MKQLIYIVFAVLFSCQLSAAIIDRPLQGGEYEGLDKTDYGWLTTKTPYILTITVSGKADVFMNESSVKRYFKLQMRNLAKDIKFISDLDQAKPDHNWAFIDIQLSKYNDSSSIYFGLISLRMHGSVTHEIGKNYLLASALAGSESQITNFIKEELSTMAEMFAEDAFYMEDLTSAAN